MSKYSINAQISEVARELAMRAKVYPRMKYGPGHTFARPSEAAMASEIMAAVKETLEWSRDNRVDVIEWIKAGKPKAMPPKQGEAA
jgi:hypothetical protein